MTPKKTSLCFDRPGQRSIVEIRTEFDQYLTSPLTALRRARSPFPFLNQILFDQYLTVTFIICCFREYRPLAVSYNPQIFIEGSEERSILRGI